MHVYHCIQSNCDVAFYQRGTPLYKPNRYVTPECRVFGQFCSENGYRVCSLWCLESGRYGFQENYGSVRTYLFQLQMSKKKRQICEFETDLKKSFFVAILI